MPNLAQFEKMSVAEKLQIMESIWDSLCHEPGGVDSPAWHQDVLTQREVLLKNNSDHFEDWGKAKANIQKQIK